MLPEPLPLVDFLLLLLVVLLLLVLLLVVMSLPRVVQNLVQYEQMACLLLP
jgi:hypothetical protein